MGRRFDVTARVFGATNGGRAAVLAPALLLTAAAACGPPEPGSARDPSSHEWRELFDDGSYRVSLDTAHVTRRASGAYLVWYETVHAETREHEDDPWNREVIRSLLRCEPLSFKTVRVSLFQDDGPPVATRGGEVEDVAADPWKDAVGSVDRAAMSRACELIGNRSGVSR